MIRNICYKLIKSCLICESKKLRKIFSVEGIQLTGYFPAEPTFEGNSLPLTIDRCESCGSLQTRELVAPEDLFLNYWYRSATTKTMRHHLEMMAKKYVLNKNLSVLDVGCNDGTFLEFCSQKTRGNLLGIDPSDAIREIKKIPNAIYINDFFNNKILNHSLLSNNKYDLITCFSVFYDFDKPIESINTMSSLLSNQGRVVIEVNYQKSFLSNANLDMLGHEHLVYYSIKSFQKLIDKTSLFINNAWENNMNGGNIVFELSRSPLRTSELEILSRVEIEWMNNFDFIDFEVREKLRFQQLSKYLKKRHIQGSRIKILGASTRGAFIAQLCGLNSSFIESAVDLQKNKDGKYVPGTDIRIEMDGAAPEPNCYLVMPYQFKQEIIARYTDFLKKGGDLIFYRPDFKIVKWSGTEVVEYPIEGF
jgi:2-polyprenyl-3-methyl-5-hydroxy-6-metoxy-1,4-benzoquinol methylase